MRKAFDENDNFLKTYADFLNRMCHVKYVPHSTMHLIASEFSSQHLKSREQSGKKLKQSLQNSEANLCESFRKVQMLFEPSLDV